MDAGILVPISMVTGVVALVWMVQAYGARKRADFLKTMRAAIERGTELSPETIKAMGGLSDARHRDIRSGMIFLALSAAVIVLGWAIQSVAEDENVFAIFSGLAAFPGFVGATLLGYGFVMLRLKVD